jgi:hypothetical protein
MKRSKTRGSNSKRKEPVIADTSRSPNRTIDDSPGTDELVSRTDIRDPCARRASCLHMPVVRIISTRMKCMAAPKFRAAPEGARVRRSRTDP